MSGARRSSSATSGPATPSGPAFPPGFARPDGTPPDQRPGEPLVAPPYTFTPTGAGPGFDVRGRLFEQRRLLVSGFLDDDLASRAAAELMLLDGTGGGDIELHVSCPDGEVGAANALADTLDLIGAVVRATCLGSIGGPALGPFTAADHRTASASAVFHLRNPRVASTGSSADLESFAERHRRELDVLHRRIAAGTGQPVDRVTRDFDATVVLDADEARRYGIVHEVRRSKPAPVTPLRPS